MKLKRQESIMRVPVSLRQALSKGTRYNPLAGIYAHSLPNAAKKPHLLSVPGGFLYRYGRI